MNLNSINLVRRGSSATFEMGLITRHVQIHLVKSDSRFQTVKLFVTEFLCNTCLNPGGPNEKNIEKRLRMQFSPFSYRFLGIFVQAKGRFTWYNFVACDMLTTSLRQESFRVNQTYNLLAIVVYDTKNVVGV